MRLLITSLTLPWPPDSGHRLRNWGLLNALARGGHRIHLVTFAAPATASAPEAVRQLCDRVTLLPPPLGDRLLVSALLRGVALATPFPSGVLRLYSQRLHRFLGGVRAEEFDAALVDDIYSIQHFSPTGIPIILNKHDITHIIAARFLIYERRRLRRLCVRLEARKLRAWEAKACQVATTVIASSDHDRDILQRLAPDAHIATAPNVIDVDSYKPVLDDDGSRILFVGSLDWLPNQDAVEFFASAILPRVRTHVPAADFLVVGRAPSPSFRRRLEALPGVHFTGTVPDVQDAYAKAAVCVVPLRIGSGTRLKILEAGAMGKAIVSTSIGAEGLDLAPDSEILIGDDPEVLAALVTGCLRNPRLRLAIGRAARRRVESAYSFKALQTSLEVTLSQFLAARSSRFRGYSTDAASGASEIRVRR